VLWALRKPRMKHVRVVKWSGEAELFTNLIERLKVARGLKRGDSILIEGVQDILQLRQAARGAKR